MTLVMAVPAASQPVVGIYTDATGTGDCNLTEALFTVQSVWVVHQSGVDAKGWRLRVSQNWNNAISLGAFYPIIYLVEPDVFGGDYFGAAGCVPAPYAFIRLDFMAMTAAPPCTVELRVLPDPAAPSGQIEVTDCNDNTVFAGSPAPYVAVNATASCPCLAPIAAEPSTWGKVKSLYP